MITIKQADRIQILFFSSQQKLHYYLELLGNHRNADGNIETTGFPNAENGGIGLPTLLDSISSGMAGNDVTNIGRAALVGLAMGIQLGRDRNLQGFSTDAAFQKLRK